jgi:trans-aconitate 2-methyltransferase
VPDHPAVLARLLKSFAAGRRSRRADAGQHQRAGARADGGCGERGPYPGHLGLEHATRGALPTPGDYYNLLRPLASHLDIWHIVYNHVWRDRRRSSNGSRARRCGRSSTRRRARFF